MSLNITEFNSVVIPVILQGIPGQNYYVKGGRCYDSYFTQSTNSSDWDVVMDEKSLDYVLERFSQISATFSTQVNKRQTAFPNLDGEIEPLVQLGLSGYSMDGDPFLLDIVVRNKELSYTTLNGLNYMPLIDFVKDIIVTYDSRANKVYEYTQATSKGGKLHKEVARFNKKYHQNIDIGVKTCTQMIEITRNFLIQYLQENSTP